VDPRGCASRGPIGSPNVLGAWSAAARPRPSKWHRQPHIDRALVILRYQQAGWTSFDIAELLGLRKRQAQNIRSLLDLSAPIIAAIDDSDDPDDPDDHCSATHGLVLGQLARRYPDLDVEQWVTTINRDQLSVTQLRRAVHKAHKPTERPRLGSIFSETATDRDGGCTTSTL